MTGIVYSLLAFTLVIRIVADVKKSSKESAGPDGDRTVDGMPLLGTALLAVGWVAYGRDPLLATGLCVNKLAQCPWRHMCALCVAGFAAGRLVQAYLFRSTTRALVESGVINPGGAYVALAEGGLAHAALVGAAMTFSQSFVEEFAFRGLASAGVAAIVENLGVRPGYAQAVGAASSSLAFGLLHFFPMKAATRGKGAFLSWYALVVPSTLAVGFCVLNQMAGSLWPGWLIHWWMNYAGLMWSKVERRWERARASAASGHSDVKSQRGTGRR